MTSQAVEHEVEGIVTEHYGTADPEIITQIEEDLREFLGDSLPVLEDDPEKAALDAHLDTLLFVIGKAELEMARNEDVATRRLEIARDSIDGWLEAENGRLGRTVGFLRGQVQTLTREYDYGRKKSRTLPFGKFGTRKKADSVEVLDRRLAISWIRQEDQGFKAHELEPIRLDPSIRTSVVAEYVTKSGVFLDPEECGMVFTEGDDHWFATAIPQEEE